MMWIALHTKFSMDNIINKSFLPNKKICLNLPDFPMIILGGERSLCTVHTGLHTAQGDELRGSKNEEIPAGIKCIPRAIHHLLCNTSSHRIWITFKIWISSLTFKSLCTIVSLGGFICTLSLSISLSTTLRTSKFTSSSRCNWTGISSVNSNGSWNDKHSCHISTAKEIIVKDTFFFM